MYERDRFTRFLESGWFSLLVVLSYFVMLFCVVLASAYIAARIAKAA